LPVGPRAHGPIGRALGSLWPVSHLQPFDWLIGRRQFPTCLFVYQTSFSWFHCFARSLGDYSNRFAHSARMLVGCGAQRTWTWAWACASTWTWTLWWTLVPCPLPLVRGSGSVPWSLVSGLRPGPGPCFWSLVPGLWSLVACAWSLVPGHCPWSDQQVIWINMGMGIGIIMDMDLDSWFWSQRLSRNWSC